MTLTHDYEVTAMALARIKEIDRKDDDQIMAELSGEVLEEMVYSFRDKGGREQKGLSWAGSRELARLQGNIRIDSVDVTETPDDIRVMVRVTDLTNNVSLIAGTHQPKMMKVYDVVKETGERLDTTHEVPDEFAFEKALSKAQRNGINSVTPSSLVKIVLSKGLEAARESRALGPGREPSRRRDGPRKGGDPGRTPDYQKFFTWALETHKLSPPQALGHLGVVNFNEFTEDLEAAKVKVNESLKRGD